MSDSFIGQQSPQDPTARARFQHGQQQIEEGSREDQVSDLPAWMRRMIGETASLAIPIPGLRLSAGGRIGSRLLSRLSARNVARNPQAARHGIAPRRAATGQGPVRPPDQPRSVRPPDQPQGPRTGFGPRQQELHARDRISRGLDPESQFLGVTGRQGPGSRVVSNAEVRLNRSRNAGRIGRDSQSAATATRQAQQTGQEAARTLPKWMKATYKWWRQKPFIRGGAVAVGSAYAAKKLGLLDFLGNLTEDEAEVASREMIEELETQIEDEEIDDLIPDVESLFDTTSQELHGVSSFSELETDEDEEAVKERVEQLVKQTAMFGEDLSSIPTDQFHSEQQKATASQAQVVAQKSGLAEQLSQVNEQATGGIRPETPTQQNPEQVATIGNLLQDPESFERELGQVKLGDVLESGKLFSQGIAPNTGILVDNFPDSRQPWEKKGRNVINNPENPDSNAVLAYQDIIFKLNDKELVDLQEDLFATGFYDSNSRIEDIRWGEVDPQTSDAFMNFLSHANFFVDENGEKTYWRTILDDLVDASTSFEEMEQDPFSDATPSTVTLSDPAALAQIIDNTFRNLAGTSPSPDTQRAFVALMREQEKQMIRQEAQSRARAQAGEQFDFVSRLNPQAQAQKFVREEHGEEVAAQSFAENTEVLDQMIRGR